MEARRLLALFAAIAVFAATPAAAGPRLREDGAGLSGYGDGKALGFAIWSPVPPEGRFRLALEIGAGLRHEAAALRPGLSLGAGFGGRALSGWVAADTRATLAADGHRGVKLDVTFGLNHPGGRKTILQLQSGRLDDGPTRSRLELSAVVPLTATTSVEAGVFGGVANDTAAGVKLGLWHRF